MDIVLCFTNIWNIISKLYVSFVDTRWEKKKHVFKNLRTVRDYWIVQLCWHFWTHKEVMYNSSCSSKQKRHRYHKYGWRGAQYWIISNWVKWTRIPQYYSDLDTPVQEVPDARRAQPEANLSPPPRADLARAWRFAHHSHCTHPLCCV
jgi:hypothetical protein